MRIEKGTKVLITGSASGIGRATALEVARRGCCLFLTDINEEGLKSVVEETERLGGNVCKWSAFDISDYTAVSEFAREIHREYGEVDVIMSIAGIGLYALPEDTEYKHWERVIKVNLMGTVNLIASFLPEMVKAKKGHIVIVSSAAGLMGLPLHSAYSTAKFGLLGLSEVLRFDLEFHNIGVSLICPGPVDTPIVDSTLVLGIDPESEAVKRYKREFRRRAVKPEKIARAIIKAVERNRFLVIPSFPMRFLYFTKKFIPPLYRAIMRRLSRYAHSIRYGV